MAVWFKPKRYGYGATPIAWQGWALTLGFVGAIVGLVAMTIGFARDGRTPAQYAIFFICAAVLVAALWIISKRTTDGEWRWRWGRDN
jgi:hypothetical protein